MTPEEYRQHLRNLIDSQFGGVQSRAAEAWHLCHQQLSRIMNGHVEPGGRVLRATGFDRRAVYVPRKMA